MAEAAAKVVPDADPGTPSEDAIAAPKEQGSETQDGGTVLLGNRLQINYNDPLPEWNSPSAKAYRVLDQRDPEWPLFALICTPGIPSRTNTMTALKGDRLKGLLPLIAWGEVDCPPLNQRAVAAIFEIPRGGRLTDNIDTIPLTISEYDMTNKFIEPMASGLQELATGGLRHRAIRPTNIFFTDEDKQDIVLGDCVTSPPGFDQPVIFEPIERAMASPGGRGRGEFNDDLYALGVTLIFMFLGRNPLAGKSDEEILKKKMEMGSYNALCSEERLPLSFIEPLRGMLYDDPNERWGFDELESWLNGRKQSPLQNRPPIAAPEALSFDNIEHHIPRTLAQAFTKNVPDAAKLIRSGKLETWLKTIREHGTMAEHIADLIPAAPKADDEEIPKKAAPAVIINDDILVAKAIIHMDPSGPIRYKGFSALPDGIGPALATEILRKDSLQIPGEIISSDLPKLWFESQLNYDPENSALGKTFEQLQGFLKVADIGYGIERCLYELNPTLPCQSPIVVSYYVLDIRQLLPTLDNIANISDPKTKPMDRHIAAFITARFSTDMTPHLKALASPEKETSLIGMLSLLALLQWKLKVEPLYGLSSWIGGLLGPAIGTYHSRTTRKKIEQDIPKLVRKGSLPELFELIDNADQRKRDEVSFTEAQAHFSVIDKEIDRLEGKTDAGRANMQRTGEKVASNISVISAMIIGMVLFLMDTW